MSTPCEQNTGMDSSPAKEAPDALPTAPKTMVTTGDDLLISQLDATDDDEPVPRAAKSLKKAGKASNPKPAPAWTSPSSREQAVAALEALKAAIGPFYNAYSRVARERIAKSADADDVEQTKRFVKQYCDLTKSLGWLWCHLHGTQAQFGLLQSEDQHK